MVLKSFILLPEFTNRIGWPNLSSVISRWCIQRDNHKKQKDDMGSSDTERNPKSSVGGKVESVSCLSRRYCWFALSDGLDCGLGRFPMSLDA